MNQIFVKNIEMCIQCGKTIKKCKCKKKSEKMSKDLFAGLLKEIQGNKTNLIYLEWIGKKTKEGIFE